MRGVGNDRSVGPRGLKSRVEGEFLAEGYSQGSHRKVVLGLDHVSLENRTHQADMND